MKEKNLINEFLNLLEKLSILEREAKDEIAEIPKDIYSNINKYKQSLKNDVGLDSYFQLQTLEKLEKKLKLQRLKKLLLYTVSDIDISHKLTDEELKLYQDIKALINQFLEYDQKPIEDNKPEEDNKPKEVDKPKDKLTEVRNEVENETVQILIDLEEYYSIDGKKYGPFKAGEIIKIDKNEAKWLIESGYAKKLN